MQIVTACTETDCGLSVQKGRPTCFSVTLTSLPLPHALPPRRRLWWGVPLALALTALLVYGGVRAAQWWEEMHLLEAQSYAALEQYLDEIDGNWGAIAPLTRNESAQLRRSGNKLHVEAGQRYGIEPAATRANAAGDLENLARLDTDSLIYVASATYSVPYLTPRARATVDTIAVRFQQTLRDARVPLYKPVLTSVLRTEEDQTALRRVNSNAARGRSSHEFATTFDLHTNKFHYAGTPSVPIPMPSEKLPAWWRGPLIEDLRAIADARFKKDAERNASRLKAALGRTLIALENEQKLLTVMERRQPVYHTTAIGWAQ